MYIFSIPWKMEIMFDECEFGWVWECEVIIEEKNREDF